MTAPPSVRRPVQPRRGKLALFLRLTHSTLFGLGLIAGCASVFAFMAADIYWNRAQAYDLESLKEYPATTRFYDVHDEEIGSVFVEDRTVLNPEEIPQLMRDAVVSIEDERFFQHSGIDFQSLSRAVLKNLQGKKIGGSTLSQQLAKHLIGDFSRSYERKMVEAFLALRIEGRYKKEEILDLYLNRIFFGRGYYGLYSAAKGYFGKSAKDLTLSECALLAGIIRQPNSASPRRNEKEALKRRDTVIYKMLELGKITQQEATDALASDIVLVPTTTGGVKNYYVAAALKELAGILHLGKDDEDKPAKGDKDKDDDTQGSVEIPPGLQVHMTIDMNMQRAVEKDVKENVARVEDELTKLNEKNRNLTENPLQAAAVVADPQTGAVRVLIGGRKFSEYPFDRATMAKRENGAVLQPMIYSLAFEKLSLSPATMINASFLPEHPTPDDLAIGDPNKDLGKRFLTIHDALAIGSVNCGARVTAALTIPGVTEALKGMDVSADFADARASSVTLWDACQTFQIIGNKGEERKLHLIESIRDTQHGGPHGEVIYNANDPKNGNEPKQVLDPLTAQQMTLTLKSANRDGQARALFTDLGFPTEYAAMPGYSVNYRDSWFVGFTPAYLGGFWMGFDNGGIGNKAIARNATLPTWAKAMTSVLAVDPAGGTFPIPSQKELLQVDVNRRTGKINGQAIFQPAAGDIFVYLTNKQFNFIERNSTAPTNGPGNWDNWLAPMLANGDDSGEVQEAGQDKIPPVVRYRLPGLRGDIITADSVRMAVTKQTQNLVLPWPTTELVPTPKDAVAWARLKLPKASAWLKTKIDFSDQELEQWYTYKRFHPLTVAENLTDAQVQDFQNTSLTAEGFYLQGVPRRIYPQGDSMAHILGYIKRQQGRSKGPYQADEVVYDSYTGEAGLEAVYNKELTGPEGALTISTTPDGFTQRALVDKEAQVGLNLRMTIDSKFQLATEEILRDKKDKDIRSAAVVFLNVSNGDIIASASWPTFNPNDFIPVMSPERWKQIVDTAAKAPNKNPLVNRAIAWQNPPGSTFKTLTTLGAIRAGTFAPDKTLQLNGGIQVGSLWFNLPKERGSCDFMEAYRRSINTYFIHTGVEAGRAAMTETALDYGFAQKTGIALPNELAGTFPTPESVKKIHKRTMGDGDLANASIGQGDVLCTPLQLANMMATIANGGSLWRPRIVAGLEGRDGNLERQFPPELIHSVTITDPGMVEVLKKAMINVVENGTGRPAQVPKLKIAAKTGTAQVGSKNKPRQIAWFAGFFPADNPQYSFAAMIEGDNDQDLHGGGDAGLLIGRILRKLYAPGTDKDDNAPVDPHRAATNSKNREASKPRQGNVDPTEPGDDTESISNQNGTAPEMPGTGTQDPR